MTFNELLTQLRGEEWEPPESLLSIDPGETTGWAMFIAGTLYESGQVGCETFNEATATVESHGKFFHQLIVESSPSIVVVEDYRIYAQKTNFHTWNALHTPRLIGAMQVLCAIHDIPLTLQMASSKQFCTNEKLKKWGFYSQANRHAMDAVRHGCYWLLFNKLKIIRG